MAGTQSARLIKFFLFFKQLSNMSKQDRLGFSCFKRNIAYIEMTE